MKNHGFTIVELLVVIVVIGILAAITIVAYTGISQKAIASALQSDLDNASKQLKLYQVEYGSFPTAMDGNNCPTAPTNDSKYCLKFNTGNSKIGYSSNNSSSSQTFFLVAGNGSLSYKVTNSTAPQLTYIQPGVTPGAILELHAAKAKNGTSPGINDPFTTQWYDTSQNGNNGTLTNFAGTEASGWATGPERLVSPGASLKVTTPVIAYGDAFTLEIIGTHTDLGVTSSNIGCFLGTGGDANGRWYFGRAWDRIMLQATDESTGSNLHGYGTYGYSITDWPANTVAHVHVVKTAATTKYYLNGSLFNTANNNVVNPTLTTLPTYVMWGRGYMAGSVSIARIYPFALTPAQITANYAVGTTW